MPNDPTLTRIEIASRLHGRTKRGLVEFTLNSDTTLMDLSQARTVLAMLSAAIEAAVSDELLWTLLTTHFGYSEAQAADALLEVRTLRQGSREAVFAPSP